MLSPGPARKVIIHLNEDTSSSRDFLYREIFRFLFDRGVAGATMIRPVAGFGSHHHVHTEGGGAVEGEHLPVQIEFLESPDVVDGLMPELCALVTDGVVEMHSTTVVKNARRAQPL
jgi:PII-like signaling protein